MVVISASAIANYILVCRPWISVSNCYIQKWVGSIFVYHFVIQLLLLSLTFIGACYTHYNDRVCYITSIAVFGFFFSFLDWVFEIWDFFPARQALSFAKQAVESALWGTWWSWWANTFHLVFFFVLLFSSVILSHFGQDHCHFQLVNCVLNCLILFCLSFFVIVWASFLLCCRELQRLCLHHGTVWHCKRTMLAITSFCKIYIVVRGLFSTLS